MWHDWSLFMRIWTAFINVSCSCHVSRSHGLLWPEEITVKSIVLKTQDPLDISYKHSGLNCFTISRWCQVISDSRTISCHFCGGHQAILFPFLTSEARSALTPLSSEYIYFFHRIQSTPFPLGHARNANFIFYKNSKPLPGTGFQHISKVSFFSNSVALSRQRLPCKLVLKMNAFMFWFGPTE